MKTRILSALLAVIMATTMIAAPSTAAVFDPAPGEYIGFEPALGSGGWYIVSEIGRPFWDHIILPGGYTAMSKVFGLFRPDNQIHPHDYHWTFFGGGYSRGAGSSRYIDGRGFVGGGTFGGFALRDAQEGMAEGIRQGFGRTGRFSADLWWLAYDDVFISTVNSAGVSQWDVRLPTSVIRSWDVRNIVIARTGGSQSGVLITGSNSSIQSVQPTTANRWSLVPFQHNPGYVLLSSSDAHGLIWLPLTLIQTVTSNLSDEPGRLVQHHNPGPYTGVGPIQWSSQYSVTRLPHNGPSTRLHVRSSTTDPNRPIYRRPNPDTPVPFTINSLDASSRIGGIHANFGHLDNNGQLIISENVQLVNETNNTWFNPVTNTHNHFGDIIYDFSTLTYNITNVNGTNTTIIFGDDYITINDNGNVIQIFFVINQTGDPDSGGTPPDTGTPPGGTPPDTGTPPPDTGSGGGGNSILDWLAGLFGGAIGGTIAAAIRAIGAFLSEVLSALADVITNLLSVIPGMFSGFSEFLSATFVFLPEEFVILILFGLVMLMVAGILKKFFS